mmetsp:Transcript_47426/g.111635  ORF Transcript_47426/g.111635 Transcript_47426/m.111635 type:complete len:139 (+) Transcript_47426:1-417(+)
MALALEPLVLPGSLTGRTWYAQDCSVSLQFDSKKVGKIRGDADNLKFGVHGAVLECKADGAGSGSIKLSIDEGREPAENFGKPCFPSKDDCDLLDALNTAVSFSLQDDKLVFTTEAGAQLTFSNERVVDLSKPPRGLM